MLLFYPNGIRVMICTANFIEGDWTLKTQGIWIQDFPLKRDSLSSSSSLSKKIVSKSPSSDFENALIRYFKVCGGFDCSILSNYDFSKATAALVPTVPGYFSGASADNWGQQRVKQFLSEENFEDEFERAPLILQYSSMGSLSENWLHGLISSFTSGKGWKNKGTEKGSHEIDLKIVYPTVEQIAQSLEGYAGGGSVPVSSANWKPFLRKFNQKDPLCIWGGGNAGRTRAVPHIKSYTRFNPDSPIIPWFLLTSANLSKPAWGEWQNNKWGGTSFFMRSYELGVLFLPSTLQNVLALSFTCTPDTPIYHSIPPDSHFDSIQLISFYDHNDDNDVTHNPDPKSANQILRVYFPIPYPIPPVAYRAKDEPWVNDQPHGKPDVFGRKMVL